MNRKRKGTAQEHARRDALEAFRVLPNTKKLVHRWRDAQRTAGNCGKSVPVLWRYTGLSYEMRQNGRPLRRCKTKPLGK